MTIDSQRMYTTSKTSDIALVPTNAIVIEPATVQTESLLPHGEISVMNRIAACESKNDPTALNTHSGASGRFQFLKSSWEAYGRQLWGSTEGKDIFSYKDNTELAYYVASKNGYRDWYSSKDCWRASYGTS